MSLTLPPLPPQAVFHAFTFAGLRLHALASGALFWPGEDALVVSDLHLGKAARLSAVGGAPLPPYETRETLSRLEADLDATGARRVICLGDSFDAKGIADLLPEAERAAILRLQTGRRWDWIEGNHDPGPNGFGGTRHASLRHGPLVFRHIACPGTVAELSGHYHPKARLALRGRMLSRPCFLYDDRRLVLPAYGAYTGGLCTTAPSLSGLMGPEARAILTGGRMLEIAMPRLAPV